MIKFINKFCHNYLNNYSTINELLLDSIIYSKYYVYFKIMNCVYSDTIMQILHDTEYNYK